MAIIDAEMLQKDTEVLSEVHSVVENLCLWKSGLSRHVKSKNPENFPLSEKSSILK